MSFAEKVAKCRALAAHPTWRRRLRAAGKGVFWFPCPVCGKNFAGDEWIGGISMLDLFHEEGPGRFTKGICSQCELDNGVAYMLEHEALGHHVGVVWTEVAGQLDRVVCWTCGPEGNGRKQP